MKALMGSILLISSVAFAQGTTAVVEFTGAKIFAPMKGSNTTAGYGVIKNISDKEVVLKIAKANPFKAVETHETTEKSGKMAMVKVDSFKIPAKGSLELKPGGNHIMLFDATREVKAGEDVVVQFMVDGKAIESKFKVEIRTDANPHANH